MSKITLLIIVLISSIACFSQKQQIDTNYATSVVSADWMPDGKSILIAVVKYHKGGQAPFTSKVFNYDLGTKLLTPLFDNGGNLAPSPDGKAIAAFHIPYDTPGNISQVLGHWRDKKTYIDHWDESDFTEFAGTLVKQGVLSSPDQYLSTLPRGGFYLHFLPFLQGMLYVGNTTQLINWKQPNNRLIKLWWI